MGEGEHRTIVSGLVKFVSAEDMTDRKVGAWGVGWWGGGGRGGCTREVGFGVLWDAEGY